MALLATDEAKSSLFVTDFKGQTALDLARLCNNDLAVAALKKAMSNSIDGARGELASSLMDSEENNMVENER